MYSTDHRHCSTYTCVNMRAIWQISTKNPRKKLACKFLHKLLHANLSVFLRWLILLTKIHTSCVYFLTTENVADVKLETDIVEKRLFTVKEKTTYCTQSLTTIMLWWQMSCFGWSAILHVNLDACYSPRLLFWNKFNVLVCVAGTRTSVHFFFQTCP